LFLTLGVPGGLPATGPNVVLIMADDLGWGDVGFNGNTLIHTPHLDELARQGLRLTRFYAAAPVCSPTRGSCLTGRHPYRYGVFHANVGHLRQAEWSLAELLREHGYATGHFGKWHLGTLTTEILDSNRGGPRQPQHFAPPWEHGFETCFSTEAKVPTWDPMRKPARRVARTWWNPLQDRSDAASYGTRYWANGQPVEDNLGGDDSRVIMDRVIPFVRGAVRDGKPFLAVVWFHAPHLPVVAGPRYTARYAQYDKYRQHYYGCITALDEQVGRLWRELDQLRVRQRTLLAFCSDNGPEGDESAPGATGGLRGRKRSLFEGGIRVPAVIVWPERISAGTTTDGIACTSDYLPTIAAALDIQPPGDRPLDGVSLLPLLEGRSLRPSRAIGLQTSRQAAWVEQRWKLVCQLNRAGTAVSDMLFDLPADRSEQRDVAAEHPEVVARMAADLEAWQASCRRSLAGTDY
jgi:arylsulfatase A-like enzyme